MLHGHEPDPIIGLLFAIAIIAVGFGVPTLLYVAVTHTGG
jgi:hypothetical protein